jgi:hypothetical protein
MPEPVGGVRIERIAPPARPSVVDEGVEFEPVWYPHKDAQSLLGERATRCVSIEAQGEALLRQKLRQWTLTGRNGNER